MDISAMVTANLDLFGEAVTYTPKGGTLVSISKALWDEQASSVVKDDDGRDIERTATVFVATTAVAAPQREAVIVRSATSESWVVDRVEPLPSGANLYVKREASASRTAGQYHR